MSATELRAPGAREPAAVSPTAAQLAGRSKSPVGCRPAPRPAAPAPLALELQPLRPLPGGLAPALHARREDRAERSDVPRPAGRRRDHALLPPDPRPRRAPLRRPAQGRVLERLESWRRGRARELGIAWETDLREDRAFKLGLDAVELTFSQLIPHLGEPVAVQRKVEYTLAPGLDGASSAPSTSRPAGATPARCSRCRRLQGEDHAADPVQGRPRLPACRVPHRALARRRSRGAVLLRPDRQAGSAPQTDRRLDRDHEQIDGPAARRAVRIAQVARQIVANYERFGPDEPWGFADPGGWKCSERYCEAWATCPGGRGL